ncbi:hypothetical protein KHA80_21225 [Anaerobacillus sp. HL2]|nr:hypothetical protein KHA80_21225 [Anaerobacillus sp. HL2]
MFPARRCHCNSDERRLCRTKALRSFTASNGDPTGEDGIEVIGQFETNTTDTLLIFSARNYLFIPVR